MTPDIIDTIDPTVEPEPECTHQAGCPRHGIVEDCDPAPLPTPEGIAAAKKAAERHEYIAGLRELADLLQGHPELILPYEGNSTGLLVLPRSGIEREQLAAWARALPGMKRKDVRGAYFDLYGAIRGLQIQVICHRDEVCERIVTGTREVTKTVRDPEALAAVPLVEVTETVEDVEWKCAPVLDGGR